MTTNISKRLTVFTPTYNRAYILPQLYESLCTQDCKDFYWLIIDDGSTDDTPSLVASWIEEGQLDIIYQKQANGGKMREHNRAVACCQTELFVCVDSDDMLASPTVIRDTLNYWDEHNDLSSQPEVCGLISYRKSENGVGFFPEATMLCTLGELYEKGYVGDTTLIYKTAFIRQHPFPEIEGEKFITEAVVYDRIDLHNKYLLHPYYSQICKYLNDGYTQNGWTHLLRNPKGYRMYYNQLVEIGKGHKRYNMKMYIACSLLAADGQTFAQCSSKPLLLAMFPLGYWQYLKLRKQLRERR